MGAMPAPQNDGKDTKEGAKIEEEKKQGPPDQAAAAQPTKSGMNEPNVPMDQVVDKLQTLVDEGKVERVVSGELPPDQAIEAPKEE